VDLIVIGAGIVGLATAYRFLQIHPAKKVIVLEKEETIGVHQSTRNSGVLHSGIYYRPSSYKAKNCITGKKLLEDFCKEHAIPYKICGKLIIATDESQLPALDALYKRGLANGVACRVVSASEIRRFEPHAEGIRAIHTAATGVVDFKLVLNELKKEIERRGGRILCGERVTQIKEVPVAAIITSSRQVFQTSFYVNCAGLYADRVLRLTGHEPPCRIVPFRGEYYALKPEAHGLCKGLIYPLPNPSFPFLGVHFTRSVNNTVECGPNAVLALAREGYNWRTIDFKDLWESLSYGGSLRLACSYWKEGLNELIRSLSKRMFVKTLQRLVPALKEQDLLPAPAGVRAQAVSPDGRLIDDFLTYRSARGLHVLNAPSPAATSCLSIATQVIDELNMI